ncbi:3-dehydroquinate synthase [Heyndrickxia sporothermodurans]|nr:3-dehydroquinate synthase [Heyndrickxia sporothermodurans]
MEKVEILTKSKNYHVFIGENILQALTTKLDGFSKVLIITDETVSEYYQNTLIEYFPKSIIYTVPSGEKAKTFNVYEECINFALKAGLDRKSAIFAFGGGAVGDLAGFVAATYMRGIGFVQIPTTILAHDSAVGGKVAINHPLGKNIVGAFYQPEMVIYDTLFLKSLPKRQIRSGFSEVIKHALIADPLFLKQLMQEVSSIDQVNSDKLPQYLKRGIEIKASFVSIDEREAGIRAFLNFGHTLGHAIEANAGFGDLTHGEAVMSGMVFALYISEQNVGLEFNIQQFIQWIEMLGYEWKIPSYMKFDIIFELMKRDKKSINGNPSFVLLEEIGKPLMAEVEEQLLKETFYKMRK